MAKIKKVQSLPGYVPYTGATADVDLGLFKLNTYDVIFENLTVDPATTVDGELYYRSDTDRLLMVTSSGTYSLAYLYELNAYVKYTGATSDVNLGVYDLIADRVAGGGSVDTMTVNGVALSSQVQGHSDTISVVESHTHSNTAASGAAFYAARSRGTHSVPAIVQNNDILGSYVSVGYDGTDYAIGGYMYFQVAGTPGSNDMPTRWILAVTADGASTPTTAITVEPTGVTTFAADVNVPDEAYGAGWNGSLEVPTKNALYNKIETISGGSSSLLRSFLSIGS